MPLYLVRELKPERKKRRVRKKQMHGRIAKWGSVKEPLEATVSPMWRRRLVRHLVFAESSTDVEGWIKRRGIKSPCDIARLGDEVLSAKEKRSIQYA